MKTKLFLATIMLAGLFCFTTSALAMTDQEKQTLITQIQAQISALMQQITVLQQNQTTAAAPDTNTSGWCHTFNVNIGTVSGNSEIPALETALGYEGFHPTSQTYDETLMSAVAGFQEKYASEILTPYGLTHGTGFVGKSTRIKLNSIYGCSSQSNPTQNTPNQDSQNQTQDQHNTNVCPTVFDPVCGKDGKTYSNNCLALAKGIEIDYTGECKPATDQSQTVPAGNNQTSCEQGTTWDSAQNKCVNCPANTSPYLDGPTWKCQQNSALTNASDTQTKGTYSGGACSTSTHRCSSNRVPCTTNSDCPPRPTTEAECTALNGTWQKLGMSPTPSCNWVAVDAGKTCTDQNDCQGTCIATSYQSATQTTIGTCTQMVWTVGCQSIVVNGQSSATRCTD